MTVAPTAAPRKPQPEMQSRAEFMAALGRTRRTVVFRIDRLRREDPPRVRVESAGRGPRGALRVYPVGPPSAGDSLEARLAAATAEADELRRLVDYLVRKAYGAPEPDCDHRSHI